MEQMGRRIFGAERQMVSSSYQTLRHPSVYHNIHRIPSNAKIVNTLAGLIIPVMNDDATITITVDMGEPELVGSKVLFAIILD